MKPSDLSKKHPYGSVLRNGQSETIAQNIMIILARTGNVFRLLSWEEYKEHRERDGNFTPSEKEYFDLVVGFCATEETVKAFCPTWMK